MTFWEVPYPIGKLVQVKIPNVATTIDAERDEGRNTMTRTFEASPNFVEVYEMFCPYSVRFFESI